MPAPTFVPDEDNVMPILAEEWFPDDIVGRFREFLKASLGEQHLQENLRFLEDSLGKDIRTFFVRDFSQRTTCSGTRNDR